VRVISGGLLLPVAAMASTLGISAADVGAVAIEFDASGAYVGFDATSPLTRAGGKRDLLMTWRRELPAPIMLVGDGATDLEAAPAADLFVAFAGIVDRASITAHADVVVRAHSLSPILVLALGDETAADPEIRELFEQGRAHLDPTDQRTHK
jgi:phosphoserine phosphatase